MSAIIYSGAAAAVATAVATTTYYSKHSSSKKDTLINPNSSTAIVDKTNLALPYESDNTLRSSNPEVVYATPKGFVSSAALHREQQNSSWNRIIHGIHDDISSFKSALLHSNKEKLLQEENIKYGSPEWNNWKETAINEFDDANKEFKKFLQKYYYTMSKHSIHNERDKNVKLTEELKKLEDKLESKRIQLKKYTGLNETPKTLNKNVDVIASKSLRGWGENAEEFSREREKESSLFEKDKPSNAQQNLDKLKKTYNDLENNLETQSILADNTLRSLHGWGETAEQLAEEEIADINWRTKHPTSQQMEVNLSNASETLNKAKDKLHEQMEATSLWGSIFQGRKNSDAKQLAQKEYDTALEKYNYARKELDDFLKSMHH